MAEENNVPQETRVTRISIGRVHNLGNYENIRYEVTVDVAPGANVGEIITSLETAMEDIRAESGNSSYEVKGAKKKLSQPASELSDFDATRIDYYKKVIADHEQALDKRQQAKDFLNQIGVSSAYKDAKLAWDNEGDYDD